MTKSIKPVDASHLPQCDGTNVFRCIFNYVDADKNGLVSLLEFMTFGVKELKLCSVNSDVLRARFHAIDCDGSGGLDFDEFEEFLADFVYEAEERGETVAEDEAHHGSALSLETSLIIYIKQEVKAHRRCALQRVENDNKPIVSFCPTQIPCDGAGQLERQQLALNYLKGSIEGDAKDVIDFWFPSSITEAMMLWFGKSPTLDDEIRRRFGGLVELAKNGDLDSWTADPLECLALIILLDQFPRNIFRHQKRMYATDTKAQAVCAKALYHNYHRTLTPLQAIFMPCLVFTHSELFHHQELCVDIWCHLIQHTLPQDDQLRIFGMIFLNHLKVVAKFGRFPHRNEILDRECTKEEQNFLNDKSFRFDLPLRYSEDGKVVFEETADFVANKEGQTDEGQIKEHVYDTAEDNPEMKQCFLQRMQSWKKLLENKFRDSDKVILEKCGKSADVINKAPETCQGNKKCPELQFDTKSSADSVTANEKSALQWTRSSGAERQTRKGLMANLLSPAKE